MNNRRSASVGALPVEKKHFVSRNESVSGALLDVRCACQYFQCESLLPDRVNPVESRPTSKLGFASDLEHGDHQHFDNMSTRSFNVPAKRPEFDRISAASYGGQMHGADGRGLVVRSISDATDPDMPPMGAPVGHRGRQMSIGGISSGSFGGRDPDAVSIRSGISLRRISRSPSHADLFVADLNIPTPHVPGQSRRGSRGEIPRLNVIAPTPTPTPGIGKMSPPDFSIYDRKTTPSGRSQPGRWSDENKENLRGYHDRTLPQNKPIDLSRYSERDEYGRPINEPMDVDIETTEPVVNIRDSIRIDRLSPPLEENVPDLSPVVKDETRIEITDFAPPKIQTIEDVLAEENRVGQYDNFDVQSSYTEASQFSQLKRQHAQERASSPDYSKKQFTRSRSPTAPQSFQRASSPVQSYPDMAYGSRQSEARQLMHYDGSSSQPMARASSSIPTSTYTRQILPQTTLPSESFQRASSPSPAGLQASPSNVPQSFQRASSPSPAGLQASPSNVPQSFQRASSPAPTPSERQFMQRGSPPTTAQSFQRASSPPPQASRSNTTQAFQKASSPVPTSSGFMQRGSPTTTTLSFQRASSPPPQASRSNTTQAFQRASSPAPTSSGFMQRGSPTTTTLSFQRASSPIPTKMHHMEVDQPEKPHEDKQSYSSRFMSMFHSKPTDQMDRLETPPQEKRKLSISQLLHIDRGRSPSPGKDHKPESSPTPSRFMSVFKKHEVPTAISVVEGTHAANVTIRKPPEDKPLTVKVTETFSLKVDEMDQYSGRPQRPPSSPRQSRLYASSDQIGLMQDRLSGSVDFYGDRQEPFAPVIVNTPRLSQTNLQAGDRNQYLSSSQSDLRNAHHFDSTEHIPQHTQPLTFNSNNKKLVSVPIANPDFYDREMSTSGFLHNEYKDHPNYSQPSTSNFVKSPSEQRLARSKLLQRKTHTSDRTQSQDRATLDHLSDLDNFSISTRSITKTVSFSFSDRDSRLSHHEKMLSSNNQLENDQWLERTYFSRDHEYEPIGEPPNNTENQTTTEQPLVSALKKEPSPAPPAQEVPKFEISQPTPEVQPTQEAPQPDEIQEAEDFQKDLEERYFSSEATTPRTESRTDYDHTSQVDSSALEELPLKPESRKKGFMASAQDRTRKMQAGLKNQAGKIKTKLRTAKKPPSGSPKAQARKRFKAPEFSKIKMPEIKRPDLSGFKRPEFTKFSKPDMSKFKLPDKFSSLKLARSKSFKEPSEMEDTTVSGTTPESAPAPTAAPSKKQKFDFSFGTYPRAFRKKKKPQEEEVIVDERSVIPSTETQPSAESSSTPQGDRGPGPVRSRWADKFSDVSYNDSEGSRYRRYGSEQESSFDRESSMERRMREVQEESAREEAELAVLSVVEQKQFADYDEENRAIHEISKTREREFKRRPIVHQDSDLVSEEGKDIGWTEREAEKNRILRQAELEAEERLRFLAERQRSQDGQSSTSSKKYPMDEPHEVIFKTLGDKYSYTAKDRKYLEQSLEGSIDHTPSALEIIGSLPDSLQGSSIDQIDYGHDVPPPKPRRLSHQPRRHHYDSENNSQIVDFSDDVSLSHAGSDYRQMAPSRPLRKGRFKHSQEISIGEASSLQYDDEQYFDRDNQGKVLPHDDGYDDKENVLEDQRDESPIPPPQAPRRRRKKLRDSVDKDSFMNGFGGRSVSNSYLKEDNKPEEVIVFRTEHEYKIPLATPENYTDTSVTPHKSRSLSRLGPDEDDRTSRGADSIALDLAMRGENNNLEDDEELHEKYIIEMMENDGYAVVRKENLPKPTPPARRKKFSRSPGERFATMPHLRRGSPAVSDDKPSTKNYSTVAKPTPPRRRSAHSLGIDSQKDYVNDDISDYEIPELDGRTESPRNLQSGDIINKMKYRPLPPPPRPPREKRHFLRDRHGDDDDQFESRDDQDDRDGGGEKIVYDDSHAESSDDYNQQRAAADRSIEVEVSTQTDPLPDDFVCEEFEITDDMKIIEPRRIKTLDEILREEEEAELERSRQIDEEVLLRGIQRFREANQRSISEKSRASSQAKSLSRPQTPSAVLIEKRVPTPVPNSNGQTVLEASLTVQPIDDLDLEEELLRREGLYDGSHSKSDAESHQREDEEAAHESEEENAKVGEESSYTRSTDAESQLHEEEERERVLQEKQRLQEQLIETRRIKEEEEQRLAQIRKMLEDEARQRRQIEELEHQRWLQQESRREDHESYDEDEKDERLKTQDSYELKSEISEEKELTSPEVPISPPLSHQSTAVDEEVSFIHEDKLLSEPTLPARAHRDETQEEPSSPQPTAPPRKRSLAAVSPEHQFEPLSIAEQQPTTAPIPSTLISSHHALPDLEVERLRVHALQAGQIMVSQLHGAQIQADEFECRSGNLVVRNIELPPGFIEDIVDRVRSTEREHSQAGTQTIAEAKTQTEDSMTPPPIPSRQPDIPPVRPPPPQQESVFPPEYVQSLPPRIPFSQPRDVSEPPILPRGMTPTDYMQSISPVGFYAYRYPEDEDEPPVPVYRRRRHHRRRDSSSDEEHQRRRSRSTRPEPQTVTQAGRQFISACSLPLINAINRLTNVVRPNADNKNDQVQPRNISAVVALFIVITLSLMLYLLTGRNIHHHHWDYFNPPGNDGRLS